MSLHIVSIGIARGGVVGGVTYIYLLICWSVSLSRAPLFRPRYQLNQLTLSSGTFADRCRSTSIGAIGIVGIIDGWVGGCGSGRSSGVPPALLCTSFYVFSSRFQLLQVVNVVIPFNQGRGRAMGGP